MKIFVSVFKGNVVSDVKGKDDLDWNDCKMDFIMFINKQSRLDKFVNDAKLSICALSIMSSVKCGECFVNNV